MRRFSVVIAVLMGSLAACSSATESTSQAVSRSAADTLEAGKAGTAHEVHVERGEPQDAHEPTDAHGRDGSAHAHGGSGEPRSLLAIMQQLGTDMTALTYGLMTDDAKMVATSARAIAEHAPIAQDDLHRIHRELGNEMAEFERLDDAVHESSVRLRQAAESGHTEDVLQQLTDVQRGCIACHARFRERLRTKRVSLAEALYVRVKLTRDVVSDSLSSATE